MILKKQDDRWREITTLQLLLSHPRCNPRMVGRIEDEIRKLKAGDRGERMAAHVLDLHYGKSPNWMLLHDLRIEHEGDVAQIDHLLISRCLDFWVLESKNFAHGVKINEHGEFLTFFEGRPRGVDSPIEQNARHMKVLQRLIASGSLTLPTRLGFPLKPKLRSLILISGGSITRPKEPIPGLETVVRSDQASTHIDRADMGGNLFDLARIISADRLLELALALAGQHAPIDFDWERRLGFSTATQEKPNPPRRRSAQAAKPAADKPSCQKCSTAVSKGVVKYCAENREALSGAILCMNCQKQRVAPIKLTVVH